MTEERIGTAMWGMASTTPLKRWVGDAHFASPLTSNLLNPLEGMSGLNTPLQLWLNRSTRLTCRSCFCPRRRRPSPRQLWR